MEHNWGIIGKIFGALLKSIIGNLKSIIGLSLATAQLNRQGFAELLKVSWLDSVLPAQQIY